MVTWATRIATARGVIGSLAFPKPWCAQGARGDGRMAAWPAQWPRALAAAIDSINCRSTTQPHGHLTRRPSDHDHSPPEARSPAGKRLGAGRVGALLLRWPASPADAGCTCTCTWLGP